MKVLVSLCTRGRYDNYLAMALSSLIMQTRKPDHITIYDDNDQPKDIRDIPAYNYLLVLMDEKGIGWNVVFGRKQGQHFNDEMANTTPGFDLVWRFDDDCVAEPDCLENLLKEMKDGVGAVGGLVIQPRSAKLPPNATNKIDDIYSPNIQWFDWDGEPREVEHLYSSFIYRSNIAHFDLRLSPVSFRGETMFNHSLYRMGYKLIVTPKARTWHFQSNTGGNRTEAEELKRQQMYAHDEQIFQDWLKFAQSKRKIYVLNNGFGDHFIFKRVINPDKDALIACCYPDVFPEHTTISIAEAEKLVDVRLYDVYAWCVNNNWQGNLADAFKKMYENLN